MQVMVDKMYSCIEQECLAFQPDDSNLLSSERSDLEFVSNYQVMAAILYIGSD